MNLENVFSTVGVHPTRCNVFDEYSQGPDDYMESLLEIAQEGKSKGKVVAIGECGLGTCRNHELNAPGWISRI